MLVHACIAIVYFLFLLCTVHTYSHRSSAGNKIRTSMVKCESWNLSESCYQIRQMIYNRKLLLQSNSKARNS